MKRSVWIIILLVLVVDALLLWWWRGQQQERSQDAVIILAASRYDMDPALIKAVIWRESRFDPDARGSSGELGLMQIRAAAANEWAKAEKIEGFHHSHLLNAKSNVLAGTWYLKKWRDRSPHTDDPLPFALAAYNAGPTKARKWAKDTNGSAEFMERIDYPATQDYVKAVKARREKYREFK